MGTMRSTVLTEWQHYNNLTQIVRMIQNSVLTKSGQMALILLNYRYSSTGRISVNASIRPHSTPGPHQTCRTPIEILTLHHDNAKCQTPLANTGEETMFPTNEDCSLDVPFNLRSRALRPHLCTTTVSNESHRGSREYGYYYTLPHLVYLPLQYRQTRPNYLNLHSFSLTPYFSALSLSHVLFLCLYLSTHTLLSPYTLSQNLFPPSLHLLYLELCSPLSLYRGRESWCRLLCVTLSLSLSRSCKSVIIFR